VNRAGRENVLLRVARVWMGSIQNYPEKEGEIKIKNS